MPLFKQAGVPAADVTAPPRWSIKFAEVVVSNLNLLIDLWETVASFGCWLARPLKEPSIGVLSEPGVMA